MATSRDKTRLGGTKASARDPHVAARTALASRHPRLAKLMELVHPIERTIPDERPLSHLVVRTVVGQLVSTAAARSIMNTLLTAHGDIEGIIAWARVTPEDALPTHSLSRAKRKAIAHWGHFVAEHGDPREEWRHLPADELVERIMALRGLGRWSAHMIAIFGFGHPEIWPDGDAGVMRAARVVFKGMRPATVRKLIAGHESHTTICCWALLDQGRIEAFEMAFAPPPGKSASATPRPKKK
jgi:DNA-3-methyladenine glycosylase II